MTRRELIIGIAALICLLFASWLAGYNSGLDAANPPKYSEAAIAIIIDRSFYSGYAAGLRYCGCVDDSLWLQSVDAKANEEEQQ